MDGKILQGIGKCCIICRRITKQMGRKKIMLDIKFVRENPDVVKQNIEFIDVKTMDDVVKHALNN